MKARRNLEVVTPKGNATAPLSFTCFDESDLVSKASSLGVSLGSNHEQVAQTVFGFREIELQRVQDCATKTDNNKGEDGAETDDNSIDLEALTNLCGEITECLGDGECDLSDLHVPLSQLANKQRPKRGKKKEEEEFN